MLDSPDLGSLVTLLWGGTTHGARLAEGRSHQAARLDEVAVVSPFGRPRALLPALPARALARALTSYPGLRDRRTRLRRSLVAMGALARLPGWVTQARVVATGPAVDPGGDGLAAQLQSLVGGSHGCMLVLRTIDAHYKPTVQLLDASGATLGFAKIGWNEGTARMVRREHDASARLRATRGQCGEVSTPATLAMGSHRGVPYHITSPLPASVQRPAPDDPLAHAAAAIADAQPVASLAGTDYLARTADRARVLGGSSLEVAVLRALADSHGPWTVGAWHGDWVPWNIGLDGATVWAWDWEHSTDEVPYGFDVLHWLITQPHVTAGMGVGDSAHAARQRLRAQPGLVGPNARDPRTADLLLAAYLLELRLRSAELEAAAPTQPALYPGIDNALRWIYNSLSSTPNHSQ
jgi:hypothetical protein